MNQSASYFFKKDAFLLQSSRVLPSLENLRKENAILSQKITFMEEQLSDYRQKERQNKKMNESIIESYRVNESFLERGLDQERKNVIKKHEEEILKLKQKYFEQIQGVEQKLKAEREISNKMRLQSDRIQVECEQKLIVFQKTNQAKHQQEIEDLKKTYEYKLQHLEEKLKQSESMAALYKQFIQKRREEDECSRYSQFIIAPVLHDENNPSLTKQKLLHRFSGSSNLTQRINKAVHELKKGRKQTKYK